MILITYGTRPEYIKVKPLMDEMLKNNTPYKVLFTGQHQNIVPNESDYSIRIKNTTDNRLNDILTSCLTIPENVFNNITHVLVQGDTTSVLGVALTCMNRQIKVIHLEAGLRTNDKLNPYPEEYNRQIVSKIADIHLCPTELNKTNLIKEGITENIHVVGNTVLDGLLEYKSSCEYQNKVLVTLHRRENHNKIDEWFSKINHLAKTHPELEFILPIHPNPNIGMYKKLLTDVTVTEPISRDDLINLLIKCKLVITDSGGIQEESSFFNKKCLVCRETTERPESLGINSFLVKNPNELEKLFLKHIKDYNLDIISPYGDGKSAIKISKILNKL